MRRKRRNHSPEFKAKVALAAIQGDLTMAELVKKFDVHANQITDWTKQLLRNASDVFGKGAASGKRLILETRASRQTEDPNPVHRLVHRRNGGIRPES